MDCKQAIHFFFSFFYHIFAKNTTFRVFIYMKDIFDILIPIGIMIIIESLIITIFILIK